MNPQTLLNAAKAEMIPEGMSRLWYVIKRTLDKDISGIYQDKLLYLPAGTYTYLYRITDSTLHLEPPGTIVMEDSPYELSKHLNFMMKAQGNVLVTGLGLGCVVRGLLANPTVDHVTCIENSKDVLKLVQPYMPKDRLTIIEADAREWTKQNKRQFDYAWHDLWTDRDKGEPHLDLWHTQIMFSLHGKVKGQGAWGTPRFLKRILRDKRIALIG